MDLIIVGDYFPSGKNEKLFEQGNIHTLFGNEIIHLFSQADFTVANLEGVFVDWGDKIAKQGPCLRASEKSFDGYVKLKINAVSLANNHSLDYGSEGLASTVKHLNKANVKFFGAGDNLNCAKKPLIVNICGIKVAFLGIAEYEFTIATETKAGANPFDELYTLDEISEIKRQVDYLVIMYHGGKEYYRYPAPYVQRRCRRFVERGADLVLCQHSHCIGCMEIYQGVTILYGQGNFSFGNSEAGEITKTGLICKVSLPDKSIEFIPTINEEGCVRIALDKEKETIMRVFKERTEEIKDENVVKKKYKEFADTLGSSYDIWAMGRIGTLLRKMRLESMLKIFENKKYDLNMINMLRCEAHRDVYLQALLNRENQEDN